MFAISCCLQSGFVVLSSERYHRLQLYRGRVYVCISMVANLEMESLNTHLSAGGVVKSHDDAGS